MANGAGHITSIDTENDINFTLTLFTHSSHAIRDIEDSPDPSEWFVREVRANNIGKWIDKFGVNWSEVAANQANERFC